jgi:parallel beta-helix repeat protein
MGKKFLIYIGILFLIAGVLAAIKFAGDNRSTVVGDASRYNIETSSGGALTRSVGGSGTGAVHKVRDGESIQAAVAAAQAGDIIRIYPGTYAETVYIDKDDIVLSGVVIDGEWPVMEGDKKLNDAVLYSGNDITVENLQIQHYKGNAIMGQAGNNFLIRNNRIIDTGIYGIFPEFGTNGLITHNVLSGIEDAAIYVGMCDNIHVTNNEVFDNVAGIEIENTRHSIVENNYAHDNTGGILVFITPGLPIKTTFDTIVRNNFIVNNNTPNFGIPGSTVAGIPAGTGILNMAGDQTTIEGNIITGNKVIGILITDHMNAPNVTLDPDADPNSDEIAILDNMMWNNGYDTIPEIKALKALELVGGDVQILNIGTSTDSCILDHDKYTTVGLKDFGTCGFATTANVTTY